jgi:hypothetical protein
MNDRALGVVDIVYAACGDVPERARAAAVDGFAHIDPLLGTDPATLVLPIGCPTAFPKPVDTWCATPAPWAGAVVCSKATIDAFRAEVPGVRLLVDTGHVADWGEDPCELLDLADHVQLRQGAPGRTQVHVDDASGTVDFAAVLRRLDDLDYHGKVSIEYFDLPENGWALADPAQWARDLAAHVRALA